MEPYSPVPVLYIPESTTAALDLLDESIQALGLWCEVVTHFFTEVDTTPQS